MKRIGMITFMICCILSATLSAAEIKKWSATDGKSVDKVEESVYAMVDEVVGKYPIDKTRIYASGHSGGSRIAAELGEHMRKQGFAGLLANGAGIGYDSHGQVYQQSAKSSVYALCGSNCFNRWDMSYSTAQIKCKNKKLVFTRLSQPSCK